MKPILIALILIHALIHFIGFAAGFGFLNASAFESSISETFALLWLLAGILLLSGLIAYKTNSQFQYGLLAVALLLSQYLIVIYWSDAKYGTIVNLILLAYFLRAFCETRFQKMTAQEVNTLILETPDFKSDVVESSAINSLPFPIRQWLMKSGVIGKPLISIVQLQQLGRMRMKPDGRWMTFSAKQFFNIPNSGFVWAARVRMLPGIELLGRDILQNGVGSMLIKLLGLFTIVDNGSNKKANSGTMIRYLAETCWFPSAVLSEQIEWQSIDNSSAQAAFTINDNTVTGVFSFTDEGDFKSFESFRYYGVGASATKEKWLVRALEIKEMNGFRIPVKSEVIWQLDSGNFKWLELEIVDINYNAFDRHF